MTFTALRSILYALGFLWLWAWVAGSLRQFDPDLGGALPAWTFDAAFPILAVGALLVVWCLAAFIVQGRGTPALFDAPRRLVAVGPYRHVRNPMYWVHLWCWWAGDSTRDRRRWCCSRRFGGWWSMFWWLCMRKGTCGAGSVRSMRNIAGELRDGCHIGEVGALAERKTSQTTKDDGLCHSLC
jgi:hypothetical protein